MIVASKPKNTRERKEALTVVTVGLGVAAIAAHFYPDQPFIANVVGFVTNLIWIWRT